MNLVGFFFGALLCDIDMGRHLPLTTIAKRNGFTHSLRFMIMKIVCAPTHNRLYARSRTLCVRARDRERAKKKFRFISRENGNIVSHSAYYTTYELFTFWYFWLFDRVAITTAYTEHIRAHPMNAYYRFLPRSK